MDQFRAMMDSMINNRASLEEFGRLLFAGNDAVIIASAKEKGFNITSEDLQDYRDFCNTEETDVKTQQKLSDDNLEEVAGGNDAEPDYDARTSCLAYTPGKSEFRNGANRKECKAKSCFKYEGGFKWCKCFKTNWCIDCWHQDCSK